MILLKHFVTTHDHGMHQPDKFPWLSSNHSPLTALSLFAASLHTTPSPRGHVGVSLQPSHTWTSSISAGSSFTSGCSYPPGSLGVGCPSHCWPYSYILLRTLLCLREPQAYFLKTEVFNHYPFDIICIHWLTTIISVQIELCWGGIFFY